MLERLAHAWLEVVWLGLWQGTLLLGAVALAVRILPMRAAIRHSVLLLALFALLAVPPVLRTPAGSRAAAHGASRIEVTTATAPLDVSAEAEPLETEMPAPPNLLRPPRTVTVPAGSWLSILFLVWCVGATWQVTRLFVALVVVTRIRRTARPLPEMLFARCAALIGRERAGRVRVSDRMGAPATLGVFRPSIVLPRNLVALLSDDELRDVLLHEVAHVERRDGLSCALQRSTEALLFHHPAVWWLSRRLLIEREWACDERVVTHTRAPHRYARSLLRVANLTRSAPRLSLASSVPGAGLSVRIERLLKPAMSVSLRFRMFVGFAAIALFTVAAMSPTARIRSTLASVPTADLTSPAAAPSTEAIASRIDATLQSYVRHGYSGVVLVAQGDRIILNKGYGLADRERRIPMTAETYFSTAGITKALTAASVLLLEQDGVLSVNDRAARFIGELPGHKNELTLHHLLTHTDGLARAGAQLSTTSAASFVASLKQTPMAYAPGSATRYTDVGYSLLGVVIERATGESYESFVRHRIFTPAGMAASRFENEPLPSGATIAREYSGPVGAQERVARRGYGWGRRASLGFVSTALDVYRMMRASETLFPEHVREQLFTPRSTSNYGTVLSYGWDVVGPNGSELHRRLAGTPGFEGEVLNDLEHGWSAVILVNSAVGWRYAVWDEIAYAFQGQPSDKIEHVLARRRYAPYRGGSIEPVRTVTPTP